MIDIVRRVPYTASIVVVMIVLGLVSQAFWRPISESAWWPNIAYGLPAFEEGKWWTPISGAFFARLPAQYIPVLGGYALMTGFAEWRIGTRWTVIATVAGQLVSVVGTALILLPFRGGDWAWAVETGRALDVGFSCGAICALVVAAMTLRAPWRARVVVGVFGYCIISLVWVGLVWDVEHVIAAALGLAIGWPRSRSLFEGDGHLSRHEARVIATALLILIAFAQILAMVFPDNGPLGPEETVVGRPLIILFVVAELLVAAGLHRGSRLAWSAATALSITGVLTATALRPIPRGVAAAVVFLPLLILLVRTRWAYTAKIIPPSSTRMTRDLALVGVGFILYVVLGFVVIEDFNPPPDYIMQARELIARLFFSSSNTFQATSRPGTVFLVSLSLIPIVVFFTVLLILLIRTRKPAAALNRERALELLHTYGGGNLSWMATWPDNAHFITADGKAAIAYQVKSGTAIALGDPVGAPESVAHAVVEFARHCETNGWTPCFFSSTQVVLPQSEQLGWRFVQVAEDTVIDLPELEFKGKAWQDVRTALNRAAKSNITFRVVRLVDESFQMVQQARGISDQWVSDKGLPEMGFTLGGIDEALDPEVRVGLAVDDHGTLQGITSWLPVYGADGQVHGWTLDVMRRLPDGFRPVMEFMIASACLAFKEQGALTVSLSGAPLARSEDDKDSLGGVDVLLNQLGEILEPVYGFRSLHQFKTKFKPRYVPMYMVFPDEAALPRVGVALTQAFLPDARLRDYASVLRS
ncbi:MAG TPA: DUF2156 domain-containing protein [Lapillicoccus sp.]|nr:DUF2156 domain-containing protein [Lapillicoccus sp.]